MDHATTFFENLQQLILVLGFCESRIDLIPRIPQARRVLAVMPLRLLWRHIRTKASSMRSGLRSKTLSSCRSNSPRVMQKSSSIGLA